MNNYTCYQLDILDRYNLKSYESRYEDIRFDSDFIGLTTFDSSNEKLIVESAAYDEALLRKRQYFSRTNQKRVFISHKMEDKLIAIALAKKLDQAGVAYWLDVLDPQLSRTNNSFTKNKAIAIANIIELALLNCTDVVAIMTDNSHKSRWIPYEYGRVKTKRLLVNNANALTHQLNHSLPEYMYLGNIFSTDSAFISSL